MYTLFPYTTLCRSDEFDGGVAQHGRPPARRRERIAPRRSRSDQHQRRARSCRTGCASRCRAYGRRADGHAQAAVMERLYDDAGMTRPLLSTGGTTLVVSSSVPKNRFPLFRTRSEEHTSELQTLMRISYAVFTLYK